MFDYFQQIFGPLVTAVGTVVVAGGGLSVGAYGLFRFFGERWLDTKFEERLAAYKHAQQRELEHLRFEINALMDRTIKLHQREFDVLPQAWSLFNDAYWKISGFMGLKSHPDLNRMTDTQLDDFLRSSAMAQWQKDELIEKLDKTTYYIDYADWKGIDEARKTYGERQIYFLKNGIFMPDEIKQEFSALDNLLRGALIEYEIRKQERNIKLSDQKDLMRLMKEGRELRGLLEARLHERLWISTKVAADPV